MFIGWPVYAFLLTTHSFFPIPFLFTSNGRRTNIFAPTIITSSLSLACRGSTSCTLRSILLSLLSPSSFNWILMQFSSIMSGGPCSIYLRLDNLHFAKRDVYQIFKKRVRFTHRDMAYTIQNIQANHFNI